MSDNWLRLIPQDLDSAISTKADKRIKAVAKKLFPQADEIAIQRFDELEFIDAGANMGSVTCPLCNEDVSEWWMKALDNWHRGDKAKLVKRAPCCKRSTSLDQFKFEWAVGFAKVVIDVMNPGRIQSDEDVAKMEKEAGTALRVIWQHL